MSDWLLWILLAYCVCVIVRYCVLPRLLAWLTGGTGDEDLFEPKRP